MIYALAACLILLALLVRYLQGSWSSPGAFFCATWVVACIPAVVVLTNYVSLLSVFVVMSFAFAVAVGTQLAFVSGKAHTQPANGRPELQQRMDGLEWITGVLGMCGIAGALSYVRYAGFNFGELLDGETWLKLAVQNSIARYRGDTEPFVVRLLMSFNYAGTLLAGVALARRTGPAARILAALPLVAAFLMTAFTTAKTPMLIGVVFAFSGWLAIRVGQGPRVTSIAIKLKRSIWLLIAGGIVAVAFVGSLTLRYGADDATPDVVSERLVGYGFGQMTALSAWLATEDWLGAPPTSGAYTFAGPFETLGLMRREKGLYEPIGLNEWSSETNVYSALRGLISDFGLPGSWLLLLIAAFASQKCWLRLRAGQGGPIGALTLMMFYAFAAWSPIVSVLAYNVVLLAFVTSGIVLMKYWKPRGADARPLLATGGSA